MANATLMNIAAFGLVEDSTWRKPGFTENNILNYLFKKATYRTNTSLGNPYYSESIQKPVVYNENVATQKIPERPPTDFVKLTTEEMKATFKLSDAELNYFSTYLFGENVFSIERSTSYNYIYRINNMRLMPHPSNPTSTFRIFSVRTSVNMLASTIPPHYGNGSYREKIYRTDISGNLAKNGRDIVLPQQLPYIYDYDIGVFMIQSSDDQPYTRAPITITTPPAITCYIYRGSFGRPGWSYVPDDTLALDEVRLLVGKRTIDDPTLVLDVSGAAFITDVSTQSISTTSDLRLKQDITPALPNPDILGLEPRFYKYRSAPDGPQEYGLIAQEVETILPEIVRTRPDGFKSVQYDRIGVALIPLIRSQAEQIAALQKELEEVKKLIKPV